jgi:hypothetical protein
MKKIINLAIGFGFGRRISFKIKTPLFSFQFSSKEDIFTSTRVNEYLEEMVIIIR